VWSWDHDLGTRHKSCRIGEDEESVPTPGKRNDQVAAELLKVQDGATARDGVAVVRVRSDITYPPRRVVVGGATTEEQHCG